MSDLKTWQESARQCKDPDCVELNKGALTAEPDGDGGDYRYYTCTICYYEFDYEKVPQDVIAMDEHGSCSVGIPEDIRRAASGSMEKAMAEEQRKSSMPLLQIGKRTS